MVFPDGIEVIDSDGSKSMSRRPSFYNEQIQLKSYNVYVTPSSGNLAVVKLSKELIKSFGDQIEIILLNKNKVQISCKSAKVANKLIKTTLAFKNMNFYIPQQKVEIKGRICLPSDITEKEAFEGMTVRNRINTNAPLPLLVEVYRIPYFDKDAAGTVTKTDSDYMLVSFCGTHIPTHLVYDNALLIPVQAYFEPVLQCKSCWFFGHSKKACRGKDKCVTCGFTHTDECANAPFCVNCKGNHRSNDKNCPEFLKRKDLSKIKALKTVPIMEVQPTPVPASFNIFNNLNFPELPSKNYINSAVVQKNKEQIGNKRPRVEKVVIDEDRKDISSEVILEDITNKIIQDLSLEKIFFSSIVEEIKSKPISGKQLEVRISKKIREMLTPVLKEPVVLMDNSNSAAGPSHSS